MARGYRHQPFVARVLALFPGAEIVDVRHHDLTDATAEPISSPAVDQGDEIEGDLDELA